MAVMLVLLMAANYQVRWYGGL